jgi:hypothetical protein
MLVLEVEWHGDVALAGGTMAACDGDWIGNVGRGDGDGGGLRDLDDRGCRTLQQVFEDTTNVPVGGGLGGGCSSSLDGA